MRGVSDWAVSVLVAGVAVFGCAGGAPPPPSGPGDDEQADARERVVHVSVRIAAAAVAAAARHVRESVTARGGYIESATERPSSAEGHASFEARIPREALPELREDLRTLGDVIDEREEATDVTIEHRDLSARIRSLHAEEARLIELMGARTDDLADVLAVERELARVAAALEQLEASERDLSARVAMARVSVEIAPTARAFADDPLARVASAAHGGVSFARDLGLGLTMSAVAITPTLALLAALALLARRARRALSASTRVG